MGWKTFTVRVFIQFETMMCEMCMKTERMQNLANLNVYVTQSSE